MGLPRLFSRLSPSTVFVLSFAITIAVGACVLLLPGMTTGDRLTPLQALFTATSATCVTGLIVVDTATDLSHLGQGVVLVLIQVGGLGILTLSTFALYLLGNRGTIRVRQLYQDLLELTPSHSLSKLLSRIIGLTLATEVVGALALYPQFRSGGLPPATAAWHAVFHSVSALCNAGFSVNTTSLMGYAGQSSVLFTISGLIILGGLGFVVLMELPVRVFQPKTHRRLSVHTKLVLASTIFLLVAGTVGIYVFEHPHITGTETTLQEWDLAFFHSVSARTAGFNAVDIGRMTTPSLGLLMALMFIGGSPGSTAGGIKTTTMALFALLCLHWLRGRSRVMIGDRAIPDTVVQRAVATVGITTVTLLLAVMVLFAVEMRGMGLRGGPIAPLALIFEAVSAFGTVGLSTGITPQLAPVSQLVIIGLMFAGRLGPLTLSLTLLGENGGPVVGRPEESVLIG